MVDKEREDGSQGQQNGDAHDEIKAMDPAIDCKSDIEKLIEHINTLSGQGMFDDKRSVKQLEEKIRSSREICVQYSALDRDAAPGSGGLFSGYRGLQNDLAKLQLDISNKINALHAERHEAQRKDQQIAALKSDLDKLVEKQKLSHLLAKVGPIAQEKILGSQEIRNLYYDESPRRAYVVAIDIRRSTDLMLKAREPKLFAQFIIALTNKLRDAIFAHYGMFDKFTGDGILCYFPEFHCGADAGYFAVQAAMTCHQIFEEHYHAHRNCFISVIKDTGLGIGIDYGSVQIVQVAEDFTVVGAPVVYACRMSGAPPGRTIANQPAYEMLSGAYSLYDFEQTEINIKNEGLTLAYAISHTGQAHAPAYPQWAAKKAGCPEA